MQSGRSLNCCYLPPSLWARTERWTSGEVNAIFYRADNGLKWRAIPREFRHANGVRILPLVGEIGVWEQINDVLVRQVRQAAGSECTAQLLVIIDSQSVKLGKRGGTRLDGNKFVKGRKRHIVVDVLGLVLGCYVTAANVADVKAAPGVLVWVLQMYQRIVKVLADKDIWGIRELIAHFFADEDDRWRWRSANVPIT